MAPRRRLAGGTGRSSEGATGAASVGTGAAGRGTAVAGLGSATGAILPRGISPGGLGASTVRLLAESAVIPPEGGDAATGAGKGAGVVVTTSGARLAVPSNPQAGRSPETSPSAAARKMRSGVRIALCLGSAAGRSDRLISRSHHSLVGVQLHAFHVLGDGPARNGDARTVQVTVIEQALHQERYAVFLEHVFGDMTAGWLQIWDV